MITIAINGFGRIGRNVLRAILQDPQANKHINVAVINIGSANIADVGHMFQYDSIMGTFKGSVSMDGNRLIIDDIKIIIIAELDPTNINWKQYGIDWVVEASGHFTKREQTELHCKAGASHVLITAPAQGEDITIIPGVNESDFNFEAHAIVSLGSCTTNACMAMLQVLHKSYQVKQGFMTTIHAYTNTQVLLDVEHKDLRRSRAAAINIIPTTTGAASMIGKIIPDLEGKIDAMAVRVPVAKVSLLEFTFTAEKAMTNDNLNDIFVAASEGSMKGIVGASNKPLVSSDYAGDSHSVVMDLDLTRANGTMGTLFGWYDNEWGYSSRVKDFLVYTASRD